MDFAMVILAAQAASAASPPPMTVEPTTVAACIPAQSIVPPFNDTPEALEQARNAAVIVVAVKRKGQAEADRPAPPICGGDPLPAASVSEPAETTAEPVPQPQTSP